MDGSIVRGASERLAGFRRRRLSRHCRFLRRRRRLAPTDTITGGSINHAAAGATTTA